MPCSRSRSGRNDPGGEQTWRPEHYEIPAAQTPEKSPQARNIPMRNLITDLEGVLVGAAQNERLASGVSVVVFGEPAVASIAVHGGAPGLRDGALLEPEMTVPSVDAIVLSGGSAFGLDAPGGVQARLLETGRGYRIGSVRVPIVPGAILFDLGNGGDKNWDHRSPYWNLGYEAAVNAGEVFALGTAGVGYGLTTYDLKGGL